MMTEIMFAYDFIYNNLCYEFSFSSSNVYVVGCYATGDVTIPENAIYYLNGNTDNAITCKVIGIRNSAFAKSSITSVRIPNSVTSIGDYAFQNCSSLTSVISEIIEPFNYGSNAFSNISSMCKLTIPKGKMNAYDEAGWTTSVFKGGIVETSFKISFTDTNVKTLCVANWDTNGDGELDQEEANAVSDIGSVFKGNTNLVSFDELQYFTGLTAISASAFRGCSGLSSIKLPNGITTIGNDAFRDCSHLSSIIIPNSVTSIASQAFFCCSELTEIIIPINVTSIEKYTFWNCSGLTSVSIPNSVVTIGNYAFGGCENLTSVTIPSSVTSVGKYAFQNCGNLTSVVSEIKEPFFFGTNAFSSIGSTCTLTVPYGTKDAYIAAGWTEDVFKGGIVEAPAPVKNITFADANVKALCVANWDTNGDGELSEAEAAAVTSIGTVFKSNIQITSFDELQYFTKLTSIEENAFYTCSSLTSIAIPNSVISIGDIAFWGCNNLTSITIPQSVTSIGKFAFSQCNGLTTIIVASGNARYDSRNNCNAIIETSSNTLVAGCKNTIIPNSVTSIGNSAFRGSTNMTDFIIPDNITSIGDFAFMNCSALTSITIPNSVKSIGNYAFDYCTSLISATIPNSVTSIGNYAFDSCSRLTFIISAIEKPFAFGNKAFYGIASTCTLTVLAGTKEAYIAAGWTENIFKGGIIETASPSPNIAFADANVKALCVANWDTNGDGELSEEEAEAVTDLGTVFKNNTQITSFDELQYFTGLTTIGKHAFYNCEKLTSLSIPNSVENIGEEAFNFCYELTSVNIPNNVTNIGEDAFGYCI